MNSLTRAYTQLVKRLWRSAKARDMRQRWTDSEMLSGYLAAFLWRHPLKDNNPLNAILPDMRDFYPPAGWLLFVGNELP